MSEHTASRRPQVRIVHHADGTASVNGAAVAVEPGQDVRDAAYLAAVRKVRGTPGPVAATRVEADGTEYPLTLYPGRSVFPASAGGAVSAGSVASALDAASASATGTLADGAVAAPGARGRSRGRLRGGARPRMPRWLREVPPSGPRLRLWPWPWPVRSLGWPAAAVCGCVLLAAVVTVLLRQNDPALLRLTLNQQAEAARTPVSQSVGQGVAASAVGVSAAGTEGGRGASGPAVPTASPRAGARQPGAAGSAGADGPAAGAGVPDSGASQAPLTLPGPAPGPRARPRPTGTAALRPTVSNLTLALIGGDRRNRITAYVITVSTDGSGPVTLTYDYAGAGGRGPVSKSVVLSGRTEYTVVDTIPSRPYCGGAVTVHAGTFPAADNGAVTATTTPSC